MKVILKCGKTVEVNNSYGSRLIEQGKAILARKKQTEAKPAKPAEQMSVDGKAAKKTGKGD